MSSSDRRTLLLALAALGGCGFAPVYAPGGPGAGLRGRIDVAAPADEEGWFLVRRLEQRLGTPEAATYGLIAELRLAQKSVGFLPDGSISRFTVDGQVDWKLTALSDGSVLLSGVERSFASYSATSTTVATIQAERDTRRRLMVQLADQIVARILAASDRL